MCGKSCCPGPITRTGVGRVPVAMPHRCANDCASCSATNGTQRNTQKQRTKNHEQNQKRKNASSAATPPSCDSSTAPRRWYKCQHRQERGRGGAGGRGDFFEGQIVCGVRGGAPPPQPPQPPPRVKGEGEMPCRNKRLLYPDSVFCYRDCFRI